MKKLLSLLVLAATMSMTILAKDPETLNIRLGQSGLADKGKLGIKFVSIVEDSRCPVGAACVWAGNAKVRLVISRGKSRKTIEVNTGIDPKVVSSFGYLFRIAELTPRPGENHRMVAQPNMVKLTIEKS